MSLIFFESWTSIFRIIFVSLISYTYLILILRISGKRTLSKMNAFDLVVTIALGSVFASSISLSDTLPVLNILTALTMLVLLQFIVTWCTLHSHFFAKLVKGSPTLIYHDGQMIEKNKKKERLLLEEIQAALRKNGIDSLEKTQSVILETDGSLTVIPKERKPSVNIEQDFIEKQ